MVRVLDSSTCVFDGKVVVLYGDMPLTNPNTVQSLIDGCSGDIKGTILTMILDNPPDFGRIVRGPDSGVRRIVKVKDADPETLEETLGVNDPAHLQFAESLKNIEHAGSLYELIDATLAMQRGASV